MRWLMVIYGFVAMVAYHQTTWAQSTLHAAVASNFSIPMSALIEDFNRQHPNTKVTVSYASSGKLYAQIKHGAPYGVFLSADRDKVQRLIDDNLADASTRFTYALGKLVLWAPGATKPPDLSLLNSSTQDSVLKGKLALANPKLAPYGFAATQVIEALGMTRATRRHWVMGENIGQTFQFVRSGNASMGFVAQSQVLDQPNQIWAIPQNLYTPIYQDAVTLNTHKASTPAREFMAFLSSEQAKQIIRRLGYGVLDGRSTP